MKPNNLKHFIFVRYNLGLYTDNVYNIEDPDEYMRLRLPMFKRLMESIKNQTIDHEAEVLVSVDVNTPEHLFLDVAMVCTQYGAKIIYHAHDDYLIDQQIGEDWLLTSRIDNDDEYYPDFFEKLYSYINSKPREELILDAQGAKERNGKVTLTPRDYPNSPFISLLEPSNQRKTVFYGKAHTQVPLHFKCEWISEEPLTKVHLHGSNAYYK